MKSGRSIGAPCLTAVSVLLGLTTPGAAGPARGRVEAAGLARRHVEVARNARRRRIQAEAAAAGPVDCAAVLNAAALRAVGQTVPVGQLQIFGDPMSFGPYRKRVQVDVFGGGGEYDVDLAIDDDCHVLSVTTRLNSAFPG